jgi:hypothetical protein
MKGWKTWLAAGGGTASGVAMIIAGVIQSPIELNKIIEGITIISGALAAVGIGHKLEKQKVSKYVIKADELKKLLGDIKK